LATAPIALAQQIQEIVTDRPDVTEASTVVPVDSLQIENGLTHTIDHGTGTLDFSESLIRYGLSDRTELRIEVPNVFLRDAGLPSGLSLSGLSFGIKQQLVGRPSDSYSGYAAFGISVGPADRASGMGRSANILH
jgi:hypothetical protein